jgi:dUTP pyrophosphatase
MPNQRIDLEVKLLRPNARLPVFSTEHSIGADLYLASDEPITCAAHSAITVLPTGLAIRPRGLINVGMFILPRSGLALEHKVTLANAVGLIDPDYEEEICIIAQVHGPKPFTVNPCTRIAQAIWIERYEPLWHIVKEFSMASTSRKGGFGHTGV